MHEALWNHEYRGYAKNDASEHVLIREGGKERTLSGKYLNPTPTATTALIGLCMVAVFVVDLVTPLGIPIWLLYGLPFLLLRRDSHRHHVLALAGACTMLMFVGYSLSSAERHEPINERFGAAIIVWFIAVMFLRRKQAS